MTDTAKTDNAKTEDAGQPNAAADAMVVRGARQNNLKNLNLVIPLHELVVVTGVSGSGKSSLVFDTLYAEGQRRYVETFSPYARQFLDRMDKPAVDAIEGIPPAIAIDQTNPVRTSRSTVGTMTELNDHLKLLFARASELFCRHCGKAVRRDSAQSIYEELVARSAAAGDPLVYLCFPVPIPSNFKSAEIRALLERQGYTRIHRESAARLEVVQDRLRLGGAERGRVMDSLEAALRVGQGRVSVYLDESDTAWRFSTELHCAECDLAYREPVPSAFSFNSPIGACETCRGFGRTIGVDYGLVIPDERKSLREGAIRTFQSKSFQECQDDLIKYGERRGVPLDTPWRDLSAAHRRWVVEGEGGWNKKVWYGTRRFFEWLESKAYKMHIRVLLSKYRAYTQCNACDGARLRPEALLWRLGSGALSDRVLERGQRFLPRAVDWSRELLATLPGLCIQDLMLLPIERLHQFLHALELPGALDEATELLLGEIRSRIDYLQRVGLGYLTLDRQSRTLSGGEVQRINLTTALGTSLVNTLFVLDEPSIGLHPRDMQRVIAVMHRLRDAGNSLLVVEHDPQIMLEADRILDLGPGAGERGGEIVFFGTPEEIRDCSASLTGDYLSGRRLVAPPPRPSEPARPLPGAPVTAFAVRRERWIELAGARAHNLRDVDLRLPLGRLVAVTGVSGSGKSTLIQDVLYAALRKALGKPTDTPGEFRELKGAELIEDVVMVDQSAIGRTTRSNPASYVGAFDVIRELFAAEPAARDRKYTAGTFSFNSGTGRCPACGGNGFEHVEMQFLSDVYLRCAECGGRRYRSEILEVKREGANGRRASIADVLDMTITEALAFFADVRQVATRLHPLSDVGLEYVKLGQPVPTLSGGEAQRLKLAGHLAEAASRSADSATRETSGVTRLFQGKLFLFDEPTTGLHFEDVAKLLRAFRKLLIAGHSIAVIEHNLDVIRAADWVVDLGPEGGDRGGEIVCTGPPSEVMRCERSHTGRALREYAAALEAGLTAIPRVAEPVVRTAPLLGPLQSAARHSIVIHKAREHNLKDIDVLIPRGRFTVITGVSGSGKSTLAFDILFNEGQRRYLESLNAYARQFVQPAARPDVDAIYGIPPTVAIEQRTSRGGRKSTVATLTEIYHFLRLLYVKLGVQSCPDCNVAIEPQSAASIAARVLREHKGERIELVAPLVLARKGYYTDLAKWAAARGFRHLRVDGEQLPVSPWPRLNRFKEHTIELPVATLEVTTRNDRALHDALARTLDFGHGIAHVIAPRAAPPPKSGRRRRAGSATAPDAAIEVYSTKRACPSCGASFAELDPRLFSFNSKHGWCASCFGTGLELHGFDEEQTGEEPSWNAWYDGEPTPCSACAGQRLNPIARSVRFRATSITELTSQAVAELGAFFRALHLSSREAAIGRDLLAEIRSRLDFLERVGLGYLALDRAAPTLSGGEAQRIRLAAQLGSNLQGVCYVLDEPTIGLHPRDNRVLLDALTELAAHRNTLVVVEHDEETIRRADHVIDLGPGAGVRGGEVVGSGTVHDLERSRTSVTGRFLRAPLLHSPVPQRAVERRSASVCIEGATLHNLKRIEVRIPLARLVVITGVSGSGKSTVARDVLYANLRRMVGDDSAPLKARRARAAARPAGCRRIKGLEQLDRILEVDQTPIGKTPRSCPATYVGFWDDVRRIFANTTEARLRGFSASRFSFNTSGGRCDACDGQGVKTIEMSFLPDVKVACEVCRGRRFNSETLAVTWRGKSIGDVLALSIDDALEFFEAHAGVQHALRLLQAVGLGYLTLGQPSPTLSGGEAQRLKLVTELSKVRSDVRALRQRPKRTLYVLDEPTVGLHMADVEKLILVLHRLVDAGNTVVVVEHNLDVMAEADWIIDMGPEAGAGGGRIVAEGSPAEVARQRRTSHTGRVLAEFLAERTRPLGAATAGAGARGTAIAEIA
jgi:excinuclease ABC subunit A